MRKLKKVLYFDKIIFFYLVLSMKNTYNAQYNVILTGAKFSYILFTFLIHVCFNAKQGIDKYIFQQKMTSFFSAITLHTKWFLFIIENCASQIIQKLTLFRHTRCEVFQSCQLKCSLLVKYSIIFHAEAFWSFSRSIKLNQNCRNTFTNLKWRYKYAFLFRSRFRTLTETYVYNINFYKGSFYLNINININ